MIKNPSLQILCAASIGTAALFTGNPYTLVFLSALVFVFAFYMAELTYAVKTAVLITKLSLLLFVTVLLSDRSGEILLSAGPICIYSKAPLAAFVSALRIVTASLPLLIVLKAAEMKNLMDSLSENCHVPPKYAFALASAFRFIPALSAELEEIIEVEKARGHDFDTKNIFKKAALLSSLMLPLLLSALKKSSRSAVSARLRGFDMRTKNSSSTLETITKTECVYCSVFIALIAAAVII